jgi:hypothetical protein
MTNRVHCEDLIHHDGHGTSCTEAQKDFPSWVPCDQDSVGNLEVGKHFDCLVVDCGKYDPDGVITNALPFDVFPDDSDLDRLEKFVQIGDDRNIKRVFVHGRCIKQA